jgi:hypothetical protein
MKAELYLVEDSQPFLKATGHAFEIDGQAGANQTSALENAETSAVGRCLMLAGYSGNKKGLASRTEMEKVERGLTPIGRDWVAEAATLTDKDSLRALWQEARRAKAADTILAKIQAVADELTNA